MAEPFKSDLARALVTGLLAGVLSGTGIMLHDYSAFMRGPKTQEWREYVKEYDALCKDLRKAGLVVRKTRIKNEPLNAPIYGPMQITLSVLDSKKKKPIVSRMFDFSAVNESHTNTLSLQEFLDTHLSKDSNLLSEQAQARIRRLNVIFPVAQKQARQWYQTTNYRSRPLKTIPVVGGAAALIRTRRRTRQTPHLPRRGTRGH
jgi:hypothetical protein